MNVKLLVTGGAGFIGSNFVKRQIHDNPLSASDIVVLDKLTYAGNLANFSDSERSLFTFIEGDICDRTLVNRIIKQTDIVVNFAAESHVDRSISDASAFVMTNVLGTQTLLDASMRAGIRKFVQVSTDEVYGSIPEGSWDEESPLLPNSPYAASKAGADLLVRSYNKTFNLDVNITRSSNNYGPYQYPEKAIPLFITNILRGRNIPIYGTGLNVRDWIHVIDHCRGIETVINSGKSGEIYNIGGGSEMTNIEIAQRILVEMASPKSEIEFVKDRLGHDLRYSVKTKKVQDIGFTPSAQLSDGLKSTISFYEENPNWWGKLVKD
jgi:dTDP-glucose 4,6-dehydratase